MATKKRQTESTQTSESMKEAIRVRTFLDGGSIPNIICDAVIDAIREASRRTGAPMPEVHPKQGYDLEALAYLFEVASTLDLSVPSYVVTPRQAASDEQEPDIRQRLPEAAGLSSDNSQVMHLVNRILNPAGQHEAATALNGLLHLIGWNDEADDRHLVSLCASIQTALYFDGWVWMVNVDTRQHFTDWINQ